MDFPTISKYLKGIHGMFVNTDFFTVGDEGETYGGIRLFELAKYAGVRHFIWSNLDYASKVCGERMDSLTTKLRIVDRKAIGKRNMHATITTPKVALVIT
jgi:NmrA-like family